MRLNPYSIGRYSVSDETKQFVEDYLKGLNPYSIGRYSVSHQDDGKNYCNYRLNPYSIGRYSVRRRTSLLILDR